MYKPTSGEPPIPRPFEPNELYPELLGTACLHPMPGTISSPRMQMFLTHIGQAPVIAEPTLRTMYTGFEREFGKYTFNVEMPADGLVVKVLDLFPRIAMTGIENPETLVIFEHSNTHQIDCLTIPRYQSLHQKLGYPLIPQKAAVQRLIQGQSIAKGTVFAQSGMIMPDGDYCIGRDANVALMSLPGVIEDGIIASESFLKKMATKGYEKRTISFGKKYYPLNLYGDETKYKPFPDIGEYCREDGLLFGKREFDPFLAPVEMTPHALRAPNYTYDDLTYTLVGKAKVIDIRVLRSGEGGVSPTPVGMETQPMWYYQRQRSYYEEVVKVEAALRRERRDDLKLSPAFSRLVADAKIFLGDSGQLKVERIYRNKPVDDYQVEITFEYDIMPTLAFKFTGIDGNKGVVCEKWKDEDMPVDANGNRADLVFAPGPVVNRMIPGSTYQPYINATSRELTKELNQILSHGYTPEAVEKAWTRLLRYYQIINPELYKLMTSESYTQTPENHLRVACQHIRNWYPPDNPAEPIDVIRSLAYEFPIPITPVTYRGRSGNIVTTVDPVLVAPITILLLEKIGDDYSGVGSARLQVFGLPAKLTNADKYSSPVRPQPGRFLDEASGRGMTAAMGPEPPAQLLEQSNDPATHRASLDTILRAPQPTNIDVLVDPSKVTPGRSRPLLYTNHMLECQGVEFVYKSDAQQPQTIYFPEEKSYL